MMRRYSFGNDDRSGLRDREMEERSKWFLFPFEPIVIFLLKKNKNQHKGKIRVFLKKIITVIIILRDESGKL